MAIKFEANDYSAGHVPGLNAYWFGVNKYRAIMQIKTPDHWYFDDDVRIATMLEF